MRKPVRDKYIGALCIRHQDHHASLLQKGWQEVRSSGVRPPATHPSGGADHRQAASSTRPGGSARVQTRYAMYTGALTGTWS